MTVELLSTLHHTTSYADAEYRRRFPCLHGLAVGVHTRRATAATNSGAFRNHYYRTARHSATRSVTQLDTFYKFYTDTIRRSSAFLRSPQRSDI